MVVVVLQMMTWRWNWRRKMADPRIWLQDNGVCVQQLSECGLLSSHTSCSLCAE